jgi:hypothetical protein
MDPSRANSCIVSALSLQAMRDASTVLGNTPTIGAQELSVDPRLIDRYVADATIDPEAIEFRGNRIAGALLFE